MRLMYATPLVCLLFGCTPQDAAKVEATQAKIESAINRACADANAAAALAAPFAFDPKVAGVMVYVQGSCAAGNAIAALTTKAVNDPATIAWAQNLAGMLKTATAQLSAGR